MAPTFFLSHSLCVCVSVCLSVSSLSTHVPFEVFHLFFYKVPFGKRGIRAERQADRPGECLTWVVVVVVVVVVQTHAAMASSPVGGTQLPTKKAAPCAVLILIIRGQRALTDPSWAGPSASWAVHQASEMMALRFERTG